MAEVSTVARRPPASQGGRARAYVEIQNGCDHRCTFCVIPFGRGNSRSTPAGRGRRAVRALVEAGYAEVVLTGVDLTSWGADLPGAPSLGGLVRAILREVPELPRLRLSSIDAAEIDAELMALPGRGAAPDAPPAPVAAGRRRPDPEADEAPALPRRRPAPDRRRAPGAPGHGLRRRPDRRLPHRDRRGVREHPGPGGGGRPLLPARLPLQRPAGHAGRAHAAGSRPRDQGARGAAARRRRRGAGAAPGPPGRPRGQRAGGTRQAGRGRRTSPRSCSRATPCPGRCFPAWSPSHDGKVAHMLPRSS